MYPIDYNGQQQNFLPLLLAALGPTFEVTPFDSASVRARPTKYIIKLEEIPYNGKVFRLNAAIFVDLFEEEGGGWCCEYKDLSSLAFGATPQEAVHSFGEDFAVLWNEIAEAPNETLAPDAQQLKEILRSLVRAVEKER
jgi:hypothetical protein